MKKELLTASLFLMLFFVSCTSQPTDEQMAQRILYQYTCAENAKVVSLKVVDSKETTAIDGSKVVEFKVSGSVQWPNGCNDFGSSLPPGHTVPFENKTILFAKTDDGWQ